jgi:hypothetical protein
VGGRPEHSTCRVGFRPDRKNSGFQTEKILPVNVPWDVSGLIFRVGLGLGRAARAFYSAK